MQRQQTRRHPMTHAAAQTGAGPTVTVAVEQYLPARPAHRSRMTWHARLLPAGIRAFVWLPAAGLGQGVAGPRPWTRIAPGIWGGVLCRKRYIDDQLTSHGRPNRRGGEPRRGLRHPGLPAPSAGDPAGVGGRPAGDHHRQARPAGAAVRTSSRPRHPCPHGL